jgi:hypothetical protein
MSTSHLKQIKDPWEILKIWEEEHHKIFTVDKITGNTQTLLTDKESTFYKDKSRDQIMESFRKLSKDLFFFIYCPDITL